MLNALCLLLAAGRTAFSEVSTVSVGHEPTFLAWRPHTRELWYSQDSVLRRWPSGGSPSVMGQSFVGFSPTGNNLLYRTSDDVLWSWNIRSPKRTEIGRSVSSWCWSGNHLYWIQDEFSPKERQWFCTAGARRPLPREWWMGAFDLESGLAIARHRSGPLIPAQVVRFDPRSLRSRPFRRLSIPSEDPGNDSVSRNKSLGLGFATYSGDSGGTTTTLEVFSGRMARPVGDLTFVEGGPEWYGSKVLADLRDFVDIGPGTNGSDTYSVVLLDPLSLKRTVIARRVVRFLPAKTSEESDRSEKARVSAPRLGSVAACADGRIAYVSGSKGGGWVIHIIAPAK